MLVANSLQVGERSIKVLTSWKTGVPVTCDSETVIGAADLRDLSLVYLDEPV
jgi:hypothetical protein